MSFTTSTDPRQQFLAALDALRAGRAGEARTLMQPLETSGAQSPDFQHLMGLILAALEDDAGAEQRFRAALRLDPGYIVSIEQLARFLITRSRAEEAVALTGDASRPAHPTLLNQHAEGMKALGRAEEAVAALREAARIAPGDAVPMHNLAALLSQLERHDEAVAAARRVFTLGRDEPETHYVLARSLMGLDEYDEAEAELKAAIALRPTYVDAHAQLSELIWMKTGDVGVASRALVAAEARGEQPGLSVTRAQLLQYAGDLDGAYGVLQAALARTPTHAALLNAAAKIAGKLGRPDEAVALASRAMEANPGDLESRFVLCETLLGVGDAASSARIAEALLRDLPGDQNAASLLATAWRILDDPRYGALYDYDAFVRAYTIDTPPGWPSLDAYLADLAVGLGGMHRMKTHPVGQSLRHGTQTVPSLLNAENPAVKAFPSAIDGPIRRYMAEIGAGEDLFRRRNGKGYKIKGIWSIRLRPDGFHADHVHPEGWISSACYVSLPPAVEAGGREGWIKFGEPGMKTRPPLAAEHFIKPTPGLLVLFPSYIWHGTVPFSGDQTRLTAAFDLVPERR